VRQVPQPALVNLLATVVTTRMRLAHRLGMTSSVQWNPRSIN
jgi:hypothetical protein